ncbi:MAG: retropepsin-like aspartic protease [Candidatus Jordarchaeaceae archaeon]
MGLLSINQIPFHTAPDPDNPKSIKIVVDLAAGGSFLANNGIILNVAISPDMLTVSTMQSLGQAVPQPFLCKALVDTGASGLAIDKSIAVALGLKRQSIATNFTANGAKLSPVYLVSLNFPGTNLRSYDALRATEVNLANQPFRCLIGREIMANWHMHYNGQTGQVSISD